MADNERNYYVLSETTVNLKASQKSKFYRQFSRR